MINEKAFEHKKYCSIVFLDAAQATDKVWCEGLIVTRINYYQDTTVD